VISETETMSRAIAASKARTACSVRLDSTTLIPMSVARRVGMMSSSRKTAIDPR